MRFTKYFLCLFVFVGLSNIALTQISKQDFKSKVLGAVLGSAVGDALGRIPEIYWIYGGSLGNSYSKVKRSQYLKDFPNLIRDFSDFRKQDFVDGVAIYTDDTQMARLILEAMVDFLDEKNNEIVDKISMISGMTGEKYPPIVEYGIEKDNKNNMTKNTNEIMERIARKFSYWVVDPDGGLSGLRAPGLTCIAGCKRLRKDLKVLSNGEKLSDDWWAYGGGGELKSNTEGGCGSVMRAYPFGLVFHDDIELAVHLAERHSMLTHRAPLARAACAAMAAGVANAVNGKNPEAILKSMVDYARRYDEKTADKIKVAIDFANTKPSDEKIKGYLEMLEGRLGDQAIAGTALVFACEHKDFARAIKLAINFYGDSDSVGAMVGALLGAYLGSDFILNPENYKNWLEPLEDKGGLTDLANRLVCGVCPSIVIDHAKYRYTDS